ncbi:MAG: T9SS type A sorting domain-containing protein [Bacteroidales bacterium]|nr:T9SS type A sorting domain-containing protein [Bacteroidales bacterium]
MKKTLLLTLALLLSVTIFAQSRISYISEHFDSDDLPTNWTFEGEGTSNWEIWGTHQAGGNPNEIKLYWKPSFEGTARMVSPAINLTGVSEMVVSFKAFLDNYQDKPHKMGVATTSDNGATWNTAWENTYASHNQGQHNIVETVSTPDMGKENVKFCIYFSGTSGNINGWYFDDIEIYTLDELNLGLMSIDMPEIANTKDNEIAFTVKNTGEETITSFTACYQIDENEVVTQVFETALVSLAVESISFQEKVTLTPGSHKLTVSIIDVNSKEDIKSDNMIESEINIALGKVQRHPMIEHFSSPTCAPCVAVNQSMTLLTERYHGQYTYTKYPFNGPLEGDPYYNDECKAKKIYYNNVNAVPSVFLDGDFYGNTFITNQDFEDAYKTPAYIELKGAFNVNEADSTIKVIVDIMPFMNLYNKRLFVSVNEKTTTENASYNGETEFHHILMKMLPDVEGTTLDFKTGEMQHFEFSYDMNMTNMEELNDLEVAVWIQDYDSFVIYNSNYLYEYTDYPYPVQNLKLADNDSTLLITWEAPEQSSPLGYNIYINDELVAENHNELSYSAKDINGLTVVRVVAVYENNKISASVIDNILVEINTESIIENTNSLNIYPNPVNDRLYIEAETEIEEVVVYDVYGRRQVTETPSHQGNWTIDLSDLKSGIYFVKINTEKGNIVKRIIKD